MKIYFNPEDEERNLRNVKQTLFFTRLQSSRSDNDLFLKYEINNKSNSQLIGIIKF